MLFCPQSLKAPNLFGAFLFECRLRHQVSKPAQNLGDPADPSRAQGATASGGDGLRELRGAWVLGLQVQEGGEYAGPDAGEESVMVSLLFLSTSRHELLFLRNRG